jgi:nitroreductase/NAD-dependent dihydropyrimidine dehydrogenase PreA subunit
VITIDVARCDGCGICLKNLGGYCLNQDRDAVAIDYSVCKGCMKCVAVCPRQAFLVDGRLATRIVGESAISAEDFVELLRRRRSIKAFKDVAVPRTTLQDIVRAGSFAPTMNREIEAIVVDDPSLIALIDAEALRFVRRWHMLLFGFRPLTWLVSLFAATLPVIKRKIVRDLEIKKRVAKPGTRAVVLLIGDPRIPVTESSAQYYLANMILMAQILGLGSCLMDSLRLALNGSRRARKALAVPRRFKFLGVLSLGQPDEKILNVPEGVGMRIGWNVRAASSQLKMEIIP